jgi:hypothetical protein
MTPTNDNQPQPWHRARYVPIIGSVDDDGRVRITDPTWRPAPQPAEAFPSDPREP